jgi:hypothetical protein
MSTADAFIAPLFTEVLLTGLSRLRSGAPGELLLGSPWLTDVQLFPGIFAGTYPYLLADVDPADVATLCTFLATWVRNRGTATLLVQGYHPDNHPAKLQRYYNEQEFALLERCAEAGVEVLLGHRFHDKFLVVPDVVLSGSVNLTYSGLYKNRERLSLHTRDSAPHDYQTARAVCLNHITSARQAGPCRPPDQPFGVVASGSLGRIRQCYRGSWT